MTGTGWERRRRKEDREWVSGHDWVQAWKHTPHAAVLVIVLVAILVGGGFAIRSVLMPAEERLRRATVEQSKTYVDGTIRDLDNLRLQYLDAEDATTREALGSMAMHRAQDFPRDQLPERIGDWLEELEEAGVRP